ncbi:MAG: DUF4910 domain-containing protein [Bacteroidota bacterium]|nr:DUF4910 domain-containing protein [Bacteroidota bacterium]
MPETSSRVDEMMELIEKINPFRRMINSPGLDKSFEIVKEYFPETIIHEYPAGNSSEDWDCPPAWEVVEGYLKDENGTLIAGTHEHYLFVAAYSEKIDGWFTKEEISKNCRCHPTIKDAYFLEHRNAYNHALVNWGITMPQNTFDQLSEDKKYHIYIKTKINKDSSMKVAELFLPGSSEEIISFTAHIDELCNDNLASCCVALVLFKYLSQLENRKYSYQLLLIPETIGTFFYVTNNMDKIENTVGMINLETLGKGENWLLKEALTPNSEVEFALKMALIELEQEFTESNFWGGYGNDERVYEWPTLNIPSPALQRFPFREYHSSHDTPENLDKWALGKAFDILFKCIEILEENMIPEYINLTPPWLSKHGLYFDSIDDKDAFHKFNNLILFNINGHNSILDLAFITDLKFSKIKNWLDKFLVKGFIKYNNYEI